MKAILFIALCILGTVSAQTCIIEKTEGVPSEAEKLSPEESALQMNALLYKIEHYNNYMGNRPEGFFNAGSYWIYNHMTTGASCSNADKCWVKDLTNTACFGCKSVGAENYDAAAILHDESLCTYSTPCNVGDFDCTALKGEYNGKCSC